MISDFLQSTDNFQEVIDFNKLQKLPSVSPIYDFYVARLWHKKVFIKRLKKEYRTNPFYVAALKKEFEIGVSLNHPSIPVYRDYKNGAIVIDYIEGETLSRLIKTGKLNENSIEIKKIISQLIEVTDYLHKNNITHCDIKTDNIIISKGTGNLILIDFDKCHTDAFDNTRANPENFGIDKTAEVTSEMDFYQISLIVREILPFVGKSDKKCLHHLISTLQNKKVDPAELRRILNNKFNAKKFFRGPTGLIALFLILFLFLMEVMFFKSVSQKDPDNVNGNETNSAVEKDMHYSAKKISGDKEMEVSSNSYYEEKALTDDKIKKQLESKDPDPTESKVSYSTVSKDRVKEESSIENLINVRMQDFLKPYADYLDIYDKAVDNPTISYDELTSLAQGSTDMLVKTMENACKNLYKEFPEIDKGEIQKIVWLSPPYLNLVNWNIEISERFGKRVMKQFNQ